MDFGHGGNLRKLAAQAGCEADELLDFSANINPLGPPEALRATISQNINRIVHYPDPNCEQLCQSIARYHDVPVEHVVVGNGSTELLYALPKILDVASALIPVPSYFDYARASELAELKVERLTLPHENKLIAETSWLSPFLRAHQIVFIGQPNNPNGALHDTKSLHALAQAYPSTFFVIDEAFADFIENYDSLASCTGNNLIVLRSMTKFYAIPGLRLGYIIAPVPIAQKLRQTIAPWSVNVLAQVVGEMCFADHDYARETRATVRRLREELSSKLSAIQGLTPYPSQVNYLLVRIDRSGWSAATLAKKILARRIAIRVCDNYAGLDERFFRVAVRTQEENRVLCDALADVLGATQPMDTNYRIMEL